VILIIALWPIPILRWLALFLNIAMLADTPIDGSHYFSDVLAGIGIGALCFLAADRIAARAGRRRTASGTSIVPGFVASE
jgi:membrane-associated phospholipid phosphatase